MKQKVNGMELNELKERFEYSYPYLAKMILDQYGTLGYATFLNFFLNLINNTKGN